MLGRRVAGLWVLLLSLLCGCGGVGKREGIRIGAVLPLSGENAEFGEEIRRGIELRMEEFRRIHPETHVQLFVRDGSGAAGVAAAFEKLVTREHVQAVIGAYSSADTFALKPLALKYRVPVLAPVATHDQITARNAFMFRSCCNDSAQGRALGIYASRLKLAKVGVFICLDVDKGDYARGLAGAMSAEFERLGGKVVKEVGYRIGQRSFVKELEELRAAGAEGVFAPLEPGDVATLIRDAEGINYKAVFFGGDSWSEKSVLSGLGAHADGGFYSCMFAKTLKQPATAAFCSLAEQAGLKPGMSLAQGYDSAGILLSLLRPGMSGEEAAAALGQVNGYEGAGGRISIGLDGDAVRDVYIKRISRDKESGKTSSWLVDVIGQD